MVWKIKHYRCLQTVLAVLVLVFLCNSGFANDKAQKIGRLLKRYHKNGQLNGSILVAEHGKVIYTKGFGFANREWDIPNRPDTKFRLASITKQFTATLILQLVEEGNLRLDGTLSDYLPNYRKDTGERITIHHLLTHTSGIPSYTGLPGFMQKEVRNVYEIDEFVEKFCSGDLEFEPGSNFRYNNSGYFLLGVILEAVTGKSYEELLHERIFEPLGMKNSGYDHHKTILKNRAAGYSKTLVGYENAPFLEMATPYSAGALYSTVEDLYLWDQALYTDKLLSAKYRDLMFTPNLNDYGYGWRVENIHLGDGREVSAISHNGGMFGFNTRIVRMIEDNHLIVLLRNAPGANLNRITQNITAILYDEPFEPIKLSAAEIIAKTMLDSGIQEGLAQYRNLKQYHHDKYEFSEGSFNGIGYQLLGMKRHAEAIAILRLNVEAYPQSANTYDSLAEAYMVSGDKQLARQFYTRVLEKLPGDPNLSQEFKARLKKGAEHKLRELQGK